MKQQVAKKFGLWADALELSPEEDSCTFRAWGNQWKPPDFYVSPTGVKTAWPCSGPFPCNQRAYGWSGQRINKNLVLKVAKYGTRNMEQNGLFDIALAPQVGANHTRPDHFGDSYNVLRMSTRKPVDWNTTRIIQLTGWGVRHVHAWAGARQLCEKMFQSVCSDINGQNLEGLESHCADDVRPIAALACSGQIGFPPALIQQLNAASISKGHWNLTFGLFSPSSEDMYLDKIQGGEAVFGAFIVYFIVCFLPAAFLIWLWVMRFRRRHGPGRLPWESVDVMEQSQICAAVDGLERARYDAQRAQRAAHDFPGRGGGGDAHNPSPAATTVRRLAILALAISSLAFPWLPFVAVWWACYPLALQRGPNGGLPTALLPSQLVSHRWRLWLAMFACCVLNPSSYMMFLYKHARDSNRPAAIYLYKVLGDQYVKGYVQVVGFSAALLFPIMAAILIKVGELYGSRLGMRFTPRCVHAGLACTLALLPDLTSCLCALPALRGLWRLRSDLDDPDEDSEPWDRPGAWSVLRARLQQQSPVLCGISGKTFTTIAVVLSSMGALGSIGAAATLIWAHLGPQVFEGPWVLDDSLAGYAALGCILAGLVLLARAALLACVVHHGHSANALRELHHAEDVRTIVSVASADDAGGASSSSAKSIASADYSRFVGIRVVTTKQVVGTSPPLWPPHPSGIPAPLTSPPL